MKRSEDEGPWWIDAVCIDQENEEEKTVQVRNMRYIFTKASRVIMWLGNGSPQVHSLFEYLRSSTWSRLASRYDNCTSGYKEEMPTDIVAAVLAAHGAAIDSVLRNEYWTRLWITQEIHAGKFHGFLTSGSVSVSWSRFANFVCHISPHYPALLNSVVLKHCDRAVGETLRLNQGIWWFMHLLKLLDAFGHCDCSDSHDRVFVLAAILTSSPEAKQVIDYTKSAEDLYGHLMSIWMQGQPPSFDYHEGEGLERRTYTCAEPGKFAFDLKDMTLREDLIRKMLKLNQEAAVASVSKMHDSNNLCPVGMRIRSVRRIRQNGGRNMLELLDYKLRGLKQSVFHRCECEACVGIDLPRDRLLIFFSVLEQPLLGKDTVGPQLVLVEGESAFRAMVLIHATTIGEVIDGFQPSPFDTLNTHQLSSRLRDKKEMKFLWQIVDKSIGIEWDWPSYVAEIEPVKLLAILHELNVSQEKKEVVWLLPESCRSRCSGGMQHLNG